MRRNEVQFELGKSSRTNSARRPAMRSGTSLVIGAGLIASVLLLCWSRAHRSSVDPQDGKQLADTRQRADLFIGRPFACRARKSALPCSGLTSTQPRVVCLIINCISMQGTNNRPNA